MMFHLGTKVLPHFTLIAQVENETEGRVIAFVIFGILVVFVVGCLYWGWRERVKRERKYEEDRALYRKNFERACAYDERNEQFRERQRQHMERMEGLVERIATALEKREEE